MAAQDLSPDERVQRRTLAAASAGTLLVLIAFVTPLATAVRTTVALGAGPGAQAWLLSAMSVGLATALLTAGVLADDLGRRRLFTVGLVVLGAGALVAGLAGAPGVFIAGRLLQGVGGAAVLACSLGLIGHAFPPGPARARAAGVWGACIGAGVGVGGLVTVALDHGTGWRTTYLVTAGISVLLAGGAWVLLTESRAAVRRGLDVAGTVLLAAGLAALLSGLVQSRGGWGRASVWVLLVAGVLLLVAFALVELRVAQPMIDLRLFAVPGFAAATIGAFTTGLTVVGMSSYLPTTLQRGLGESLLAATVLLAGWSAVSTVTALSVRWLPRVDGRVLLVAGLAVSAVGLAATAAMSADGTALRLVPGLLVLGVGYGAANAALGREAVAHVPATAAAMGSGANNTARYIGAGIGTTIAVLAVGSGDPAGTPAGLVAGWDTAALIAAVGCLVGAGVVAAIRPRRVAGPAQADGGRPAPPNPEPAEGVVVVSIPTARASA